MSTLLILTMIFSVSVQASTPIQIKPLTVDIDLANAQSASFGSADSSTKRVLNINDESTAFTFWSTAGSLQTVLDEYDGYANVIQYKKSSSKNPYIRLDLKDADGNSIDEGVLTLYAKIYVTEDMDSAKRHFRIYQSSSGVTQKLYEDADAYKWVPNVWYDVTWTINMDSSSDNVSLVMVPELSASSSSEVSTRTINHTYSYDKSEITYLRIDMLPSTTNGYVYISNLKTVYSSNSTYNKAEILDIGSSGEVAFNQNNIRVKLSNEIPGLKMEHISIKNAGDQDIAISSANVSSDGTHYYVDVVTANPLPAWTQYNLKISADAWGKNSLQNDGSADVPVTAIDEDFFTPAAPFDMKDPVFSMSAGKLKAETTIINTTGTPENVTVAIVIYGADGRIKSVTPTSYDNFEAAYPGTDITVIGGNFAEGDTAKLIAINGWDNPVALFGKYWTTSYSELN